ncbi:putative periplasmic protease [Citrobacter koseri]|nr:putative periplasmic protease [Citrobacter koseri]
MRPVLDIEQVATGEHWYGQQALEKGLVDEINTSDDVILRLMDGYEVFNVRFMQRKKLMDRFTGSAAESADRLLLRWWQRRTKTADVKLSLPGGANAYRAYGLFCRPDKAQPPSRQTARWR